MMKNIMKKEKKIIEKKVLEWSLKERNIETKWLLLSARYPPK